MPAVKSLLLRDGLTFLVLCVSAGLLFAGTSLLFGSFSTRRAELAKEFVEQGRQALDQHQPETAIEDLRTALEYGPEDRTSHLLLAEALAEGHHTQEAMNYFAGLREVDPADGFINFQLARLYRQTNATERAIDAYRAATLGIWDGDGVGKRLQVQLEFSDYLISLGRLGPARAELLAATGSAPESAAIFIRLGDEFHRADDPEDALGSYQKAVHLEPANFEALSKAGQQAYEMHQYEEARHLLQLALKKNKTEKPEIHELAMMSDNAARLEELSLSRDLPDEERTAHLRLAMAIAKSRLATCITHTSTPAAPAVTPGSQALDALTARWKLAAASGLHEALADEASQDQMTQLIFDTEIQTANVCGTPSGDDALLLLLADSQTLTPREKPE